MKLKFILACVAVAVASSACKKKTPPPVTVETLPPQPVAKTAEGAPVKGNEAEMAFSNAQVLTMMLQEFMAKNARAPRDLTELGTIQSYGRIPPAPAGYRYVIDGQKKQVTAVKN